MTIKVIRRLGKRLDHIFQWVNSAPSYASIWDLCCDHGRLGLHLHEEHPSSNIYLVDKVPSIVDKLIADYGNLQDGRLHFQTADVGQLDIPIENRTLVIIAGVGGQNLINMLESILSRVSGDGELEFILSPNSHMFELRRFLKANAFALIEEAFVTEKCFSHEHLWLRYNIRSSVATDTSQFEPVSVIGEALWQDMTDAKRLYLRKLTQHYQRMLDNQCNPLYEDALKAYKHQLLR